MDFLNYVFSNDSTADSCVVVFYAKSLTIIKIVSCVSH